MVRIKEQIITTNDTYLTLFDKIEAMILRAIPSAIVEADIEEDNTGIYSNKGFVRRRYIIINSDLKLCISFTKDSSSSYSQYSRIELLVVLKGREYTDYSIGLLGQNNLYTNSIFNNNVFNFEIIVSELCYKFNHIYCSKASRSGKTIDIIYTNDLIIYGDAEDSDTLTDRKSVV